VDLPRHRVELELRAHAADLAEVEGKEVEEESAVRLRGQREHLALVVRRQRIVDELQIRRFSAEARTVVDDLGSDLFRRVIEEDHGGCTRMDEGNLPPGRCQTAIAARG